MSERSLGVIVPNGQGPQPATVNMPVQTVVNPQSYFAASYRVQHWPGNQGKIFIGTSAMEFSSGDGVSYYVPAPADVTPGAFYQSPPGYLEISNPADMATVFIDTEIAGDGALVTYVEA